MLAVQPVSTSAFQPLIPLTDQLDVPPADECPQRDSNPCRRLERAVSWASRRWGLTRRAGPLEHYRFRSREFNRSPRGLALSSTGEYVSQVGIEPTTRGLKVPCSATELLAQALPRVYSKTTLSSTLRTNSSVGNGAAR